MASWTAPPPGFRLSAGQVIVWRAALDWPAEWLDAWSILLDQDERLRASRFRFPLDRGRFIARRLLLRAILGRFLKIPPAQVFYQYGPYGKPYLDSAGLCFNTSHSAGMALVAVAARRQVGVDLEYIRSDFASPDGAVKGSAPGFAQVAERFFSPRERSDLLSLAPGERPAAFFAAWTRKEAYIKAVGQGLSLPLDAFDVTLRPGASARLLAARQGLPGPEAWSLHDLDPAPGFAGALCVQGQVEGIACWSLEDPTAWLAQTAGDRLY